MIYSSGVTSPSLTASYAPGLRKLEASSKSMIYADVAIDTTTRELCDRLFTYEVPDHLRQEVFIGSQVLVPFGHQNLVAGYVISISEEMTSYEKNGVKFKPIVEVLESEPLFDKEYVGFLYWVAAYYCANIVEVITAAVPASVGPRVKRVVQLLQSTLPESNEIVRILQSSPGNRLSVRGLKQRCSLTQGRFFTLLSKLRQQGIVSVEREAESKVAPKVVQTIIWTGSAAVTKKQEEILTVLKRSGGQMALSALAKSAGTTYPTIKKMCNEGILQLGQTEILRDPLGHLAVQTTAKFPQLTDQQADVYKVLSSELDQVIQTKQNDQQLPWLLHGVTGSGKTEIYLRLIKQALENCATALMLVPEISLTPQLASRLVERFGDSVAVWHSALSPGERFDTWRRIRAGQVKVLLGARSSILVDLPDLRLIILDEEHDGSYKQSSPNPRYNAKTLAVERGKRQGALVLFGSATPDVATFYDCRDENRILTLPDRVFKQTLPESKVIDMRQEFMLGNRSIFSQALKNGIKARLEKREQVILLLNRRGYASHVLCRACGHVTKCPNCSVSLVFHQSNHADQTNGEALGHLMCHHCGFHQTAWATCPSCTSPFIKQFGLGTQRVEEEARALFPEARLLRLDSDVTSRKGAYEEIFNQFVAGEADILIGTQIVAKGLDIAMVTLVGVLAADAAFNLPDYRSLERGFQLLTQVSGRAGRGSHPGQVILQSYNVDLPALTLARKQEYQAFFDQEIQSREAFQYPPYSQIIRVVITGENELEVEFACQQLAEELSVHLEESFSEDEVKILGPAPCLILRLRNRFRHHLIVKNMAGEAARAAIAAFLKLRRGTASISLSVDVDALDLI